MQLYLLLLVSSFHIVFFTILCLSVMCAAINLLSDCHVLGHVSKQLTLFKYSFATPRTRESTSGQQECQKSVNETGCAQRNHSEASGQESQDSNAICQQLLDSFFDITAMTSSTSRASDIPTHIATDLNKLQCNQN